MPILGGTGPLESSELSIVSISWRRVSLAHHLKMERTSALRMFKAAPA